MIEKCFEGEGQEEEKRLLLRFTVNIYLQKLINLGQEDLILKHSFRFHEYSCKWKYIFICDFTVINLKKLRAQEFVSRYYSRLPSVFQHYFRLSEAQFLS